MIRVGCYVQLGESAPMRVIGLFEEPAQMKMPARAMARCRAPAPNGSRFKKFDYSSHPLAVLKRVEVQLVCDICGKPAEYDNGRSALRFFCREHARPGDTPCPKV